VGGGGSGWESIGSMVGAFGGMDDAAGASAHVLASALSREGTSPESAPNITSDARPQGQERPRLEGN